MSDIYTKLDSYDAEFILYDRTTEREFHVDPDAGVFDFEFTFGDNAIVVEFDS